MIGLDGARCSIKGCEFRIGSRTLGAVEMEMGGAGTRVFRD